METVISTSKLHKCIKVIHNVIHKGDSISKDYFKSWSVLIRYNYTPVLPKSYLSESDSLIKAKVINEDGTINWQSAHGIIMDEL